MLDLSKSPAECADIEQIERSETLLLHLALPPETPAQSATSTSSAAQPQGPRNRTPQHESGNTNAAAGLPNLPQGSGAQPTTATFASHGNTATAPLIDPSHGQHQQMNGTMPNGQFPPQLQQAFAQMQAVNQQLAAQLASVANNPGLQGMNASMAQTPPQQPAFLPPSFQQIIAIQQQQVLQQQQNLHQQRQQQTRAADNQTGAGAFSQPPAQPAHSENGQGNPQDAVQTRSTTPGNTSTVIRENHGLNGERWQMVIQSGQVNINPHSFQNQTISPPGPQTVNGNSTQGSSAAPDGQSSHGLSSSTALLQLQSTLSAIEATIALNNPVPESVFRQARERLRDIPDLTPETRPTLSHRLEDLAHRASHIHENLQNHLNRAAQERLTAQRTNHGTESSAVYVLSSPSGPQALLVSPSGLFSTPWQFPALSATLPQPFIQHHSHLVPVHHQVANPNIPSSSQQPIVQGTQAATTPQNPPQQVDGAQAAQVQQQQQANQARDLLRILIPLGGHLWLLIRLLGFVYFFTAGAGWRRTILLGLAAGLVFVAQTGIFRPVIQAVWDPIRRHAEGLVPLAGNERPRIGVAEAPAAGNGNVAGTQPQNRDLTPQEAAERLLQERERQDVNLMRQTIRRVERAIALFVASLVPGVGERHIAAREAAEAARQAEAREREDQSRRAEEEVRQQQQQQQEENPPGNDGQAGNPNLARGNGRDAAVSGQDHNTQPPLVEV